MIKISKELKALNILKIIYNDCKEWNKKGFETEYSAFVLKEAINELEELNNRSCESCKYSFDIFTDVNDSLLGEDFICTKLEVDKVFEKDFYCSEFEAKGE